MGTSPAKDPRRCAGRWSRPRRGSPPDPARCQTSSSGSLNAAGAGVKRKLIRGGIALAVLVAVVIGVVGLLPGLSGVRSAIGNASPGWVLAAAGIQMVGVAGAIVFVQLAFSSEPCRLTWRMGGAMQAANAVLPTRGGTLVSYWTLSSVGWRAEPFAERTAVMIIASAAPNLLSIIVLGLGMGLGLFAGPDDWWLTFLPATIAVVIALGRSGRRAGGTGSRPGPSAAGCERPGARARKRADAVR
jgi:hypothetical protein